MKKTLEILVLLLAIGMTSLLFSPTPGLRVVGWIWALIMLLRSVGEKEWGTTIFLLTLMISSCSSPQPEAKTGTSP